MIDIKTKRCEFEDCDKLNPVFDIKGGKGKYCGVHKTSEILCNLVLYELILYRPNVFS